MNSVVIPNVRLEEMRRINTRIAEATDELDKDLYKMAKQVGKKVPYEKLDQILEESIQIIKKKQRHTFYRKMINVFISICGTMVLGLSLYIIKGTNKGGDFPKSVSKSKRIRFFQCTKHGTNLTGVSPVTGFYRQV